MTRPKALADASVLLDCRWLDDAGPGRVARVALTGLARMRPAGSWLLWGPVPPVLTWPGATVVPAVHHPRRWSGQRDLLGVPRHDCAVYLHQLRPLRRGPTVNMIYDSHTLRCGDSWPVVAVKRQFLRLVGRMSDVVLTISRHSRDTLVRDLGIPPQRIRIVDIPADMTLVDAVRQARSSTQPVEEILFVGRFDVNKNLERLMEAFSTTRFAARGGRLRLVGGSPGRVADLRRHVASVGRPDLITIEGRCPEAELVQHLASARLVVMPSLEEGLGLPALEAALAGIPVATSNGGALADFAYGIVPPFDPLVSATMAAALDEAVVRAEHGRQPPASPPPPDVEGLARSIVVAVEEVLARR